MAKPKAEPKARSMTPLPGASFDAMWRVTLDQFLVPNIHSLRVYPIDPSSAMNDFLPPIGSAFLVAP
eukprot:5094622-Heterocapsa_arctica.AAC.1